MFFMVFTWFIVKFKAIYLAEKNKWNEKWIVKKKKSSCKEEERKTAFKVENLKYAFMQY